MSKGKYSPCCPHAKENYKYKYNADGKIPPEFKVGMIYDERLHFGNYDNEGYDSYGYSTKDIDGSYVGIGRGVDRNGYTENEYIIMSDYEFYNIQKQF